MWSERKEQLLKSFCASENGLSSAEAKNRTETYGKNRLSEGKKKSLFTVFLEQFKDLLVIILCVAAAISFISGDRESTIVIFAVLILNAVLGTVQYAKAEKSLESLKAMSAPVTKVLRDGIKAEIPSEDIVPGDIILLEAGDLVTADGRIIENYTLKVDESALTGESLNVEKTEEVIEGEEVALGDRKNMVFSGSLVTYGRANVLVTGTGMNTEIGKIAGLMNATKQRKTPLQASLDKFSQKLAIAIIGICIVVFALSVFRSGMETLDAMMFAIALAVAAIPEALSSIVTIVLAIGTQKMAKQNAIIKDLKAVESLGCVSVICSDKTGTLTQNRMTVQKLYVNGKTVDAEDIDISDEASRKLLKIALLNSDATTDEETGAPIGDPTEVALVMIGDELGVNESEYRKIHPRIGELAFDSDRKLMSTLYTFEDKPMLMVKGALDVMLSRSDKVFADGEEKTFSDEEKRAVEKQNFEFSNEGLRVLAFGYRTFDEVPENLDFSHEDEITFVGLAAMMDPPREESKLAVADAKKAGIKTVMITGDHRITAAAIAKQIGIFEEGDMALNGVELEKMTDAELDEILPKVSVYARVAPEHKIRIVNAWQRRGAIAAMTGDGVNDAPALKKADIGIAMGITGTEVSKDAASIILADDNFATIVKAVVNGRAVYTNIKNSIGFLLSGNMAGILSVLYAAIMGLAAPFAAVHLLFINLLTDSLPAIAIGMEPAQDGLLNQKPRDPSKSILDKPFALKIFVQGALIAVATMIAYHIGLGIDAATASTMAFATLTLARLFHGFNSRGEKPFWNYGIKENPVLIGAFFLGVLLLAAVLFIPGLSGMFSVAALTIEQVGTIACLAIAPTILIQIYKALRK
ncbi:MAG: cation-translocating P-type ATPase [Oscillospiraceae bacterium]|nr:cation-translocating P-type ATPase [Oscillospiraceae bacterium]